MISEPWEMGDGGDKHISFLIFKIRESIDTVIKNKLCWLQTLNGFHVSLEKVLRIYYLLW